MNSVFLEAAGHGAQNPILPATYDIVWSAIIFLPILLVVVFVALPAYNKIADERAAKIQEGLDLTEKAKADTAAANQRIEAELAAAREEASKIRDEANSQAEDIVARARSRADEEAKRIVENAQRQIVAERQTAQLSLRADVGLLAMELAEKIVGEHLENRELSARVVDRFLEDLEKQTTA